MVEREGGPRWVVEEEALPGCELSRGGGGSEGGQGGLVDGEVPMPLCVQILRGGEMVDHALCAKHSGVSSVGTLLDFWSTGYVVQRYKGCCCGCCV